MNDRINPNLEGFQPSHTCWVVQREVIFLNGTCTQNSGCFFNYFLEKVNKDQDAETFRVKTSNFSHTVGRQ